MGAGVLTERGVALLAAELIEAGHQGHRCNVLGPLEAVEEREGLGMGNGPAWVCGKGLQRCGQALAQGPGMELEQLLPMAQGRLMPVLLEPALGAQVGRFRPLPGLLLALQLLRFERVDNLQIIFHLQLLLQLARVRMRVLQPCMAPLVSPITRPWS